MSKKQNIQDIYPLSPLQQGLLFHTLHTPESRAYFLQTAYEFKGTFNEDVFKTAWQQIIAHHPSLRTIFVWNKGKQPFQLVYRQVKLPWNTHNWIDLTPSEQKIQLTIFLETDREQGFNLSKQLPIRLNLFHLATDHYYFVWSFHHIALDGWSVALLLDEVFKRYKGLCTGLVSTITQIRPYSDYIAWLRQQDLGQAKTFWRQTLTGFTVPTPLGVNLKPISQTEGFQTYQSHNLYLSSTTTMALQSLARQQHLTVNTVLQGIWAIILSCYSGQQDVVFGGTVSGRPAQLNNVEKIVGLFINTLPIRIQISPSMSCLEWLKELQIQQLEIRQYEYSPLAQIQNWSNIRSGQPLFESIFIFENYPSKEKPWTNIDNLTIQEIYHFEHTHYPLTIMILPDTRLCIHISYNTQYFAESTIKQLLGHWQTLIENILINPTQSIFNLPMLTQAEQKCLLIDWNDTDQPYANKQCIHHLFESQVNRTPNAIALIFEDRSFTYYDLNSQANQLASYLQHLGVGPEVLVAICLERSSEMIVALLAVLKAGGTYVPLDPVYPEERLAFMVEDAQVSVLLTQQLLKDKFIAYKGKLLCVDNLDNINNYSQTYAHNFFPSNVIPTNLAYVIYTSGSTGNPKGVQITHQAVVNFLESMSRLPGLSNQDTFLSVTTISFDIAVLEIFLPLIVGAKVVLVSNEVAVDGIALLKLLNRSQVTCMQATPATWYLLLAAGWTGTPELTILCGGEAFPFNLARDLLSKGHSVWNMYGPTETTIWSTIAPVKNLLLDEFNEGIVPIGRPIANTQLYVLNSYLQLVPIGVWGELYIGGDGLSRGYKNTPALTSEKFIPNPFVKAEGRGVKDEKGSRLYKTGDLVRYLPDGNIEFMGRIDNQIKIRGFRIEIGEIEVALTQHSKIQQAVVSVWDDEFTGKQLVAYIILEDKFMPTTTDLRQFLSQKLPHYMLPSIFINLKKFPLTPNGKINRLALPAPDLSKTNKVFVEPRNQVEERLVQIWSEVLGVKKISIYDNFFELGGDSIVSIQLVVQANKAGLKLTSRQVFQYQTIAELSKMLSNGFSNQPESESVVSAIPFTPRQHWFFEQNFPEQHHWNQAILLTLAQPLQSTLLEQVCYQLVSYHDALRLRFKSTDTGWQQYIIFPNDKIQYFTQVDLSTMSPSEQQTKLKTTIAEFQTQLNLNTGLLLQMVHFKFSSHQPDYLLVVIHHLVVDAVSWRILLADIQTIYEQLRLNRPVTLPLKTITFKNWAIKLNSYAQSDTIRHQIDYWLNISQQPTSSFPFDFPMGLSMNTEDSALTITVSLTLEETQLLLYLLPEVYQSQINAILLTALVQTFVHWTGETTLLFDLEDHGREEIEDGIEPGRMVGWFTTIFPVYLRLVKVDNPRQAVQVVQQYLDAIPQKGMGYGLLRYLTESLYPTLDLAIKPQLVFNYLGQFDQLFEADSFFTSDSKFVEPACSPLAQRCHLIAINSFIMNKQLQISWTYSKNLHRLETIENLASTFITTLQTLINYAQLIKANVENLFNWDYLEQLLKIDRHLFTNMIDIYPVSAMQMMMLHQSLSTEQLGVYHVQQVLFMKDKSLNVQAFKTSLQILVNRHPMLRTVFIADPHQEIFQMVRQNLPFNIVEHDICHLNTEDQEIYLQELLMADRNKPFDWQKPDVPLFRFAIILRSETKFEFFVTIHHAITDGWSNVEFLNELFKIYTALKNKKTVNHIKTNPLVYKEFVALEKEMVISAEAAKFWQQTLQQNQHHPLIPRNLSAVASNQAQPSITHQLSPSLVSTLYTLAQDLKVSRRAVFLSAYLDLIARQTNYNVPTVGVVTNGRSELLSDPLKALGLYWYMVPFCFPINPDDKQQQIKMVQQALINLEPYVRYSLDSILADQQKEALFFATFNFVHFHKTKTLFNYPNIQIISQKSYDKFHFPLNLAVSINPLDKKVGFRVEYNHRYFGIEVINELMECYIEILAKLVQ